MSDLILSAEVDQLAAAMVKVQGELPVIPKTKQAKIPTKNGGEYRYWYADLEDVVTATRPLLVKHGLCVKQYPTRGGLMTVVMHSSGQYMGAEMDLMPWDTPQAQGSAVTYARRYAYCAALGIVADEDDDGASATHAGATRREPTSGSNGSASRSAGKSPAVSEKQTKLILQLAAERRLDGAEFAKEVTGVEWGHLTVADASKVIDALYEKPKAEA